LIIYFDHRVKKIFEEEKDYGWVRPERCPKCGSARLWGHGYVERYFEGFKTSVWMKRWRCPDCGGVHTMRPKDFWRRFRHRVTSIVKSLEEKISLGKWLDELSPSTGLRTSREAQQYWWRGFGRQCGRAAKTGKRSLEVLERLVTGGVMAATHSLEFFRIETQSGICFSPAGRG
jgi:hypothetical protein